MSTCTDIHFSPRLDSPDYGFVQMNKHLPQYAEGDESWTVQYESLMTTLASILGIYTTSTAALATIAPSPHY